jgi:hypothetical protein
MFLISKFSFSICLEKTISIEASKLNIEKKEEPRSFSFIFWIFVLRHKQAKNKINFYIIYKKIFLLFFSRERILNKQSFK